MTAPEDDRVLHRERLGMSDDRVLSEHRRGLDETLRRWDGQEGVLDRDEFTWLLSSDIPPRVADDIREHDEALRARLAEVDSKHRARLVRMAWKALRYRAEAMRAIAVVASSLFRVQDRGIPAGDPFFARYVEAWEIASRDYDVAWAAVYAPSDSITRTHKVGGAVGVEEVAA